MLPKKTRKLTSVHTFRRIVFDWRESDGIHSRRVDCFVAGTQARVIVQAHTLLKMGVNKITTHSDLRFFVCGSPSIASMTRAIAWLLHSTQSDAGIDASDSRFEYLTSFVVLYSNRVNVIWYYLIECRKMLLVWFNTQSVQRKTALNFKHFERASSREI